MTACSIGNTKSQNVGKNRTVLFSNYGKSKKQSMRRTRNSARSRKKKHTKRKRINSSGTSRRARKKRRRSKKKHSKKYNIGRAPAIKGRPLLMALTVGNYTEGLPVRKHVPVTKDLASAIDKAKTSSIPELSEHYKSPFKMGQLLSKLTTLEEQNSVAEAHYDELKQILEENGVKVEKTPAPQKIMSAEDLQHIRERRESIRLDMGVEDEQMGIL